MPFKADNLRRIAYGGFVDSAGSSPIMYHSYATDEDLATVKSAGFFNGGYHRLNKNDIIFLHYDLDGTPGFTLLRVTASSQSGVTVAQIAASDWAP